MSLITRIRAWRARRRHLAHMRRLRKQRVIMPKPWAGSVVHNLREPNR